MNKIALSGSPQSLGVSMMILWRISSQGSVFVWEGTQSGGSSLINETLQVETGSVRSYACGALGKL